MEPAHRFGSERPFAAAQPRAEIPGLPPGVRPLDHLADSLRPAPGEDRPLLVLTHRSPDPDALGAMAGVEFLLREYFDYDAVIASTGRIFRAENQAMVRELSLEFREVEDIEPSRFRGALLVDAQPTFGNTDLPEGVRLLAVFDHHQPPPMEEIRELGVPHYDVRLGLGATAALIYEYIRDAGLELDPRTATALCCGVRFDTADLSVASTELDREAFFETFRASDRRMLARISRPLLPPTYYRELHRSLSRARRHGPLVYGFMGRVTNPESVAEMADFFLRMEGCRWSLVGGAFESNYHVSLRTDITYGPAYPIMSRILEDEGSFGGRGPVAGGQIPLTAVDDTSLRLIERRLRARALALVRPDELDPDAPRYGTRLTRLQ